MARPDKALATARDVLAQQVCECGCLESTHVFVSPNRNWTERCACRRPCREFRPVQFTVYRTPAQRKAVRP